MPRLENLVPLRWLHPGLLAQPHHLLLDLHPDGAAALLLVVQVTSACKQRARVEKVVRPRKQVEVEVARLS